MSYRTLHDRVLIKRGETDKVSSGGIILAPQSKEKAYEGIVVTVGPGKLLKDGTTVTPAVKKGDKILFAKYTGAEFKINGVEHLILREDEILAVIEE